MTTKYFALLTNQGAAKLANAAALGTKVNIASMGVGDGGGTLPTPDAAQTKLIGEKRRAQLNSLTVDAANSSQIIAEQIIPESEGGFWIREIGLYDADGVLIAVANCPETYKPQLAEGSGRTQTVRMILIVNSTTAVTLKIDPSVVLATRKYVDDAVIEVKAYADGVMKKHLDADNPHSQYLQIANALAEIKDAGLIADVLKNLGIEEPLLAISENPALGNDTGSVTVVVDCCAKLPFPHCRIRPFGNLQYPLPLFTIEKKLISGSWPVPLPTTFFAASPKPTKGEYAVGVQYRDKSSFSLTNTGPDTTQQGIWWIALGI